MLSLSFIKLEPLNERCLGIRTESPTLWNGLKHTSAILYYVFNFLGDFNAILVILRHLGKNHISGLSCLSQSTLVSVSFINVHFMSSLHCLLHVWLNSIYPLVSMGLCKFEDYLMVFSWLTTNNIIASVWVHILAPHK